VSKEKEAVPEEKGHFSGEAPQICPTAWDKIPKAWEFSGEALQIKWAAD
jgi:hypothetical protein